MKKSAHSLLYLLVLLLGFLVPLLQLHLIVLTLPNVDHSAQCCPRYASCYGQVWHRWFLINFFFKITTASSWWIIYLSFCPFFWRFGILVLVFTSHELKTKAKRRREWIYLKKLNVAILFSCSIFLWRGTCWDGHDQGIDLRGIQGSTLQTGISCFVAWGCEWLAVDLHRLWLLGVIIWRSITLFQRDPRKEDQKRTSCCKIAWLIPCSLQRVSQHKMKYLLLQLGKAVFEENEPLA
jgi:hypothetical protein